MEENLNPFANAEPMPLPLPAEDFMGKMIYCKLDDLPPLKRGTRVYVTKAYVGDKENYFEVVIGLTPEQRSFVEANHGYAHITEEGFKPLSFI